MSHDPWGGGSDLDPKMRVRELEDEQRTRIYRMLAPTRAPRRPRVSVLDALIGLIATGALLAVAASLLR